MSDKKKIVKLAVIRDNEDTPCPFGLPIAQACSTIGEYIERMAPLSMASEEATPEDLEKVIEANLRVMRWALMMSDGEPRPCKFAGKLFPDKQNKVECNYDDTAPGVSEKGVLLGSPFYSQHFSGVGLDGLYSYPMGWLQDPASGLARNTYYGLVSLQGSSKEDDDHLVRLARYIEHQAMLARTSANKKE